MVYLALAETRYYWFRPSQDAVVDPCDPCDRPVKNRNRPFWFLNSPLDSLGQEDHSDLLGTR